jgi:(2Fe-2S) ferredoxin
VDAVAGSGIDPDVLSAVTDSAARSGTRILLVRRPGRNAASQPRRWQLVSVQGDTMDGFWAADGDLLQATAAMADKPSVSGPRKPIILVCTHGVHDACCAIRGRPVAAALAERWPDQVWECSHVGGDRFAPNVVVLPDGYYYGNLDPATAVDTVQAHLSGAIVTENLRGMAGQPPAIQAAVIAAHAEFGPLSSTAIVVGRSEHVGPQGGHGSTTDVDLTVSGGPSVRAHVLAVRRPAAQLTCRAERETPATEYQVLSLVPSAA